MQKPLTKKTWNKHHASFLIRGFCPRSKKGRPSINEFAKDLAMANMVENVGEDGKQLMNFIKGGEPFKRAKIDVGNLKSE